MADPQNDVATDPAACEIETVTVPILVTDTGAHILASTEREDILEAARNAVLYYGAHAFAVRMLSIDIELLPTPEDLNVTDVPFVEVDIPPEAAAVVEAFREKMYIETTEAAVRVLMEHLPVGRWEITRSEHNGGMRRIEADDPEPDQG
ncbi:MAG: hypothetical protein ABIG71_02000 [Candidatus Uhrbacteria bacterium]